MGFKASGLIAYKIDIKLPSGKTLIIAAEDEDALRDGIEELIPNSNGMCSMFGQFVNINESHLNYTEDDE